MSENKSPTAIYRIYCIDFDGRFIKAEIIEANNDLDALVEARKKMDGKPIELWCGDRFMARLEPKDS